MTFADATFDVVISSAVLHFARDEAHWDAMLREMWRVLKPAGLFFARLATDIGHETRVRPLGNRRYVMPDGDERFLVDESYVMSATARIGGTLVDPLKTSVVQNGPERPFDDDVGGAARAGRWLNRVNRAIRYYIEAAIQFRNSFHTPGQLRSEQDGDLPRVRL
jgi:SAM-dependent methyltransferase